MIESEGAVTRAYRDRGSRARVYAAGEESEKGEEAVSRRFARARAVKECSQSALPCERSARLCAAARFAREAAKRPKRVPRLCGGEVAPGAAREAGSEQRWWCRQQ